MTQTADNTHDHAAPKKQRVPSILVVDDEFSFRHLVRRALAKDDYDVTTAASVKEAAAALRKDSFDLIILDICVPTESAGLDFLQALKRDPRTANIPVLAATGHSTEEMLTRSLELGACEHINKVCELETLKRKIAALIKPEPMAPHQAGANAQAPVLYVEDDDGWAKLVMLWLEQGGFAMQRVCDGREMRSYFKQQQTLPACILMDMCLKDSDGLRLSDEIKSNPALQRIPIVVFTAHPHLRLAALSHEALYVIAKTHDAEKELLSVLKSVLLQQEKTRGVTELGDLRLDAKECQVSHNGAPLVMLNQGLFSVLRRLVERSPYPVAHEELRHVAVQRTPYRRDEPPELPIRTLETYVSKLRKLLGEEVGARIRCESGAGYVYVGPGTEPLS